MALVNTFAELNLLASQSPRLELTPRRRIWATVTVTAAVSTVTPVNNVIVLEDTLLQDDGLIVDYMFGGLSIAAAPTPVLSMSGNLLAIASQSQFILELGPPQYTILQPQGSIGSSYIPIPYLSARDIDSISRLRNAVSIFATGQQPLRIIQSLGVTNSSATATPSVTSTLGAFYRIAHSLEEG